MTLTAIFDTLVPASNGTEYSAFPNGDTGTPSLSQIPNFIGLNSSLSINILTTYGSPTTGCTIAFNGPSLTGTGFSFSGDTWAYDGTTVTGSTLSGSFTITETSTGNTYTSNTFMFSGAGASSADTTPPTIPLAVQFPTVSQTEVIMTGYTPSDPAVPGQAASGLASINVIRDGSALHSVTIGPGNSPVWLLTDITTPTTPSTMSQSGADVTLTTNNKDPNYPTQDGLAFAYQAVPNGFVLSGRVNALSNANAFSNLRLEVRASNAPGSAYVAVVIQPFSGGQGIKSEARATTGAGITNPGSTANSAAVDVFIVNVGNVYSMYSSPASNGNALTSLGSVTQNMGATVNAGLGANSNDGSTITGTIAQASLQTLGNWSYTDTTATTGSHTYTFTSTDVDGNTSAVSNGVVVNVPGSGTGGAVPYHQGWYGYSYNIDGTGTDNPNEINILGGSPIRGYVGVYSMLGLRTLSGSSSSTTKNFTNTFLADFQQLAQKYSGQTIRFCLGVVTRAFAFNGSASQNPANNFIPSYILNGSQFALGPDGTHHGYMLEDPQGGGVYGTIGLNLWDPPSVTELVNLYKDIAQTSVTLTHGPYAGMTFTMDTHPQFELAMILDESIVSQPIPNYSPSGYKSGLKQLAQGVAAAFPNTSTTGCFNWIATGWSIQDLTDLIAYSYSIGQDFSGPDIYDQNSSTPGGIPGLYIDAQQIYCGEQINGSGDWTTGGIDYRGGGNPSMGCSPNVQQPDESSPHNFSPAQIASVLATLGAGRVLMGMISGGPSDWTSQVIPYVTAHPNLNGNCPSNYPMGCITT